MARQGGSYIRKNGELTLVSRTQQKSDNPPADHLKQAARTADKKPAQPAPSTTRGEE